MAASISKAMIPQAMTNSCSRITAHHTRQPQCHAPKQDMYTVCTHPHFFIPQCLGAVLASVPADCRCNGAADLLLERHAPAHCFVEPDGRTCCPTRARARAGCTPLELRAHPHSHLDERDWSQERPNMIRIAQERIQNTRTCGQVFRHHLYKELGCRKVRPVVAWKLHIKFLFIVLCDLQHNGTPIPGDPYSRIIASPAGLQLQIAKGST